MVQDQDVRMSRKRKQTEIMVVLGGGGFIGYHLAHDLHKKYPEALIVAADQKSFDKTYFKDLQYLYEYLFCGTASGSLRGGEIVYHNIDLRYYTEVEEMFRWLNDGLGRVTRIYQLAADLGGAGYLFTGEHDYAIMNNSARINLNVSEVAKKYKPDVLFYSSSTCVYPEASLANTDRVGTSEDTAYPAQPDSEYGWEKLFSERLYLALKRNCGINVKIARFHNTYGPYGAWRNGREKSLAALCRKVAMVNDGGTIEVWGPGTQTRSFLYIDDCLDGIEKLVLSDCEGPLNIGSEEKISINDLAMMIAQVANKKINIQNVDGPVGIDSRVADYTLMRTRTGWKPRYSLWRGLELTYKWIEHEIK